LRVDVASGAAELIPLPQSVLHRFIGGVGLGTWLLLENTVAGLDPFDPAAALVLVASPLVSTPLTTSAKFAVVGKSPLTNRLNDSLSSSEFALALKRTGVDAIVLRGRCDDWSVVRIDNGLVRIESMPDLTGLPAKQAQAHVRDRFGRDYAVMAIGAAGEQLVRYATISHEQRHAGRGGLGAVLGSKLVKAVAVRGDRRVSLAHPDRVIAMAKDLSARSFGPATKKYRDLGTVANLLTFNRLNVLPTRNFQHGTFDAAERISGEALATVRGKVRASCAACTIGCEHIYPIDDGAVRLEYESVFALGPLCGVGDRDVILRAARLCDEFGIDTISFGGTFAFACECVERGWLGPATDVDLRFGSSEGLLTAARLVGTGCGTGRVLAQGSRRLAESIGPAAAAIAPHVKGLELPGYEPRGLPMMALGFAVNSRGADHNRSSAYEVDFAPNRDRLAIDASDVSAMVEVEDRSALLDSLILCKFLRGVFTDLFAAAAEMLSAVTGQPRTRDDMRQSGADIVLLKRRYNEREGWSRAEDTLPGRFLDESVSHNSRENGRSSRQQLDEMIQTYYRLRGLTDDGRIAANCAGP
jgi:aldehyde:ferredoxin oxidoreductase